jgi:hypothetical protein
MELIVTGAPMMPFVAHLAAAIAFTAKIPIMASLFAFELSK